MLAVGAAAAKAQERVRVLEPEVSALAAQAEQAGLELAEAAKVRPSQAIFILSAREFAQLDFHKIRRCALQICRCPVVFSSTTTTALAGICWYRLSKPDSHVR